MIALAIVLIYVVMALIFAHACEFYDERPSDKYIAGLCWPIVAGYLILSLITGKAHIRRNKKP